MKPSEQIKEYEAILTKHGFKQNMPQGAAWQKGGTQFVTIKGGKKIVRWDHSTNHSAVQGACSRTLENYLSGKLNWWK